jgi:predicted amidohydrolase
MNKTPLGHPNGHTTLSEELSRRGFLTGAAALGAASLSAVTGQSTQAAMGKGAAKAIVKSDGTYDTVALTKDSIRIGVMQTRVLPVDPSSAKTLETTRTANFDHMLKAVYAAQELNPTHDVLFFHEFPITGFNYAWTRKDIERIAIELPGPETEALGAMAKKHQSYIVFGSYARDKAWPGHVLSVTTVIGPDGSIVDKHWKARNITGLFTVGREPIELMTTTIYNVLDQFIEMYGQDAVIPVTRTPYGNFCTSSVQREPELFRAMAIKGGEVFLRTATGGFTPGDIEMCSIYNRVYTAICNNAVSPGSIFLEDAGGGGSAVYNENGRVIAQARSEHEQIVTATIPIKQFRATHRQPEFAWELYRPVLDQYLPKYPPSKFSKQLPATLQDAHKVLNDPANRNW